MKSIIFRVMLVLAAFAVVPDSWAADTAGGNIFLDAQYGALVGKGNSTGDEGNSGDSTTAWGADGGYLWKLDDARSFGFELGYMHFGQVSNNSDALGFTSGDTTASAMTVGLRAKFLLGDDKATIVQLRGGLAHVKFTSSFSFFAPGGNPQSGTDSSYANGPYFGLGIGRQLTQGFSVLLALNFYTASGSDSQRTDLNANWIGLEAQYEF